MHRPGYASQSVLYDDLENVQIQTVGVIDSPIWPSGCGIYDEDLA
jgi:hypothetical protein